MKNPAKISLKKINGFRTALAGIVNKVVHDKKHALFPGDTDGPGIAILTAKSIVQNHSLREFNRLPELYCKHLEFSVGKICHT